VTSAGTYANEIDLASRLGVVTRARGGKKGVQGFLSTDPLASERSWVSPYNFVQNSPLWRVDPTGAIDTIGINAQGVVDFKIPAEGKHVFIDIPSGTELFLNDPTGADENISDAWYIEKGEKFLTRLKGTSDNSDTMRIFLKIRNYGSWVI